MHNIGGGDHNVVENEDDDFTYTEDASGTLKKVAVEKEFVFKVVVLGDYSVGKTCLIKRMLHVRSLALSSSSGECLDIDDSGDDEDELEAVAPTVGTDFYSLALPQVLPGVSLRLQLWDTAGLPKYAAKYESTFRAASFVMCVFDVTSARSLHNVVDRHLSVAAEHIPELDQSNIMVVANKIDVIRDMSNATALHDARRRAQSPGTAFTAAGHRDEDTATDTEFRSPTEDFPTDEIVTAKDVQAEVFDIFNNVHYAEVSAKTRQHVRSMLRTMAFTLLRNSPETRGSVDIPETESPYDVFAHTVLPMEMIGSSPARTSPKNSPSPKSATVFVEKPAQTATPRTDSSLGPPSWRTSADVKENGKDQPGSFSSPAAALPPTKPAASWATTGAFKFDMAPSQIAGTTVFSPMEGSEESPAKNYHNNNTNNASPCDSLLSSAALPASATTVAAPPFVTTSRASAVKPDDVKMDVEVTPRVRRVPPGPIEPPQARKEREQAEMKALLGRANQRKSGQRNGDTTTGEAVTTADALWKDADKMEDDVAAGRSDDEVGVNPPRRPFPSILDSLGVQDDKSKKVNHTSNEIGPRSDDGNDDEGVQMHARLQDRYAQIEHDIRQNHSVEKKREKKANKAKGKCKCVLM